MVPRILAGLDIGTCSVKAAVAERTGKGVTLKRIIERPSGGMRKGAVCDVGETAPAVAEAVEEIKKFSKGAARNLYVNIGTPEVSAQDSKGIVAVSRVDNEIHQDDIDRVTKASEAVNLSPNRVVIHTITREFIVDGVRDIANPLGLSGSRLEVASVVVDAFEPHLKSLMRAVEMAGGEIGGLVFDPISVSRAVLTETQKELGVVLVDMGFGTTSIAVYEERKLIGVKIFPVGGGNITNDIAVGLRIPIEAAEEIKIDHASALPRSIGVKESIELGEYVSEENGSVSRRFVAEIVESRVAEILEFVNNELKRIGRDGQLPGGAVFAGGAAKIPGLTELAKKELRLSARMGTASLSPWMKVDSAAREMADDPGFANVLGLLLAAGDEEGWWEKSAERTPRPKLKNIFSYFLP